jgi:SAM-dependent methyltransferase
MDIATQEVSCPACGCSNFRLIARTRDFCYRTCDNEFDYVCCLDCGQLYLHNRPTLAELDTIYPAQYISNDYEAHLGAFITRLRDVFQRTKIRVLRKHLKQGDLLAEIGCGAGDYLDMIRRLGDPTWEVIGIEFSEVAVTAMHRRGLRAIQARIEDIEWSERLAGGFIMNQLIEHVDDPRLVLRKCFQSLRAGGILVLETPNANGWDRRMFPGRYWAGWHAPRHWAVFDPDSLTRMARQEGYEVAQLKSILSPYVILHSLQYLIRERWKLPGVAKFSDVTHVVPLLTASLLDQIVLMFGGTTSNMQVVLRKP